MGFVAGKMTVIGYFNVAANDHSKILVLSQIFHWNALVMLYILMMF